MAKIASLVINWFLLTFLKRSRFSIRTKILFRRRFRNPLFCQRQAGCRAPFSYNFSCWSFEKQLQECTWNRSNFSPLAKKCIFVGTVFSYFHPGIFKPTGLLVWVLICKDLRIVYFKLLWFWVIFSELKTWKNIWFLCKLTFSHIPYEQHWSSRTDQCLSWSSQPQPRRRWSPRPPGRSSTSWPSPIKVFEARLILSNCLLPVGWKPEVQYNKSARLTQVRLSQMTFLWMSPREASGEENLTGLTHHSIG